LMNNTTGDGNTALGSETLVLNTRGIHNTAVGTIALASNTTGSENTAVGWGSLANNTTGVLNTAEGVQSLFSNTIGESNTSIGYQSMLANTTGSNNTALGVVALALNTTGVVNTAIGHSALNANVSGIRNVSVGALSGLIVPDGNENTFLGYTAGADLTTGDNNIYIGATVSGVGAESNTIRIGNIAAIATFIQGIFGQVVSVGTGTTVFIDSTGKLGTVVSSRKFKQNIENMNAESERIYDLTPVKFIFKKDETRIPQYGLIAEDVAEVFPELVINDKEGKPYSVRYEVLPVLLLNEMQKQQQRIRKLDNKVEFMSAAFNNLKKQVEKFARN